MKIEYTLNVIKFLVFCCNFICRLVCYIKKSTLLIKKKPRISTEVKKKMETARTIGDNIDTTGCIAEHGGFVELQFFDLDVSKSFSI